MPLYQIQDQRQLTQLINSPFQVEKELQTLIEGNLLSTFGVRFIASEFQTRGQQAGRIDTLGLSEGAIRLSSSISAVRIRMSSIRDYITSTGLLNTVRPLFLQRKRNWEPKLRSDGAIRA